MTVSPTAILQVGHAATMEDGRLVHTTSSFLRSSQANQVRDCISDTMREHSASVRQTFRAFDSDRSGRITWTQFRDGLAQLSILETLAIPTDQTTMEGLLKNFDVNNDGIVDVDDFEHFLNGPGSVGAPLARGQSAVEMRSTARDPERTAPRDQERDRPHTVPSELLLLELGDEPEAEGEGRGLSRGGSGSPLPTGGRTPGTVDRIDKTNSRRARCVNAFVGRSRECAANPIGHTAEARGGVRCVHAGVGDGWGGKRGGKRRGDGEGPHRGGEERRG